MEWNSASESGGSASDFGADTGSVAAPASSSAGPARRGSASDFAADTSSVAAPASSSAGPARSKRVKQSRSIPWGPFQIAPIVPAAGHSGWGAICGQHCDRGNSLSCKKAMNRGSLTDAECVLRLKVALGRPFRPELASSQATVAPCRAGWERSARFRTGNV